MTNRTSRPARSYQVNYRDQGTGVGTATKTIFAVDQYAARAQFEATNPGATVIIVRRG